jgi:hypothetical protein
MFETPQQTMIDKIPKASGKPTSGVMTWHNLTFPFWVIIVILLIGAVLADIMMIIFTTSGTPSHVTRDQQVLIALVIIIFLQTSIPATSILRQRLLCIFLLVFQIILLIYFSWIWVSRFADFYNCKSSDCSGKNSWPFFIFYIFITLLVGIEFLLCKLCFLLIDIKGSKPSKHVYLIDE